MVERSEATNEKFMLSLIIFIIKYKAIVLMFYDLSWYNNDNPKTLALAWEEIVAKEREDLEGRKLT